MSRKKEVDVVDVKILDILKQDASISNKELADKIGLSPSPTLSRVSKLKENKIINSITADVNYLKFGYKFSALLMVRLESMHLQTFTDLIQESVYINKCVKLKKSEFSSFDALMLTVYAVSEESFVEIMGELYSKCDFSVEFEVIPIDITIKNSSNLPISPDIYTGN